MPTYIEHLCTTTLTGMNIAVSCGQPTYRTEFVITAVIQPWEGKLRCIAESIWVFLCNAYLFNAQTLYILAIFTGAAACGLYATAVQLWSICGAVEVMRHTVAAHMAFTLKQCSCATTTAKL